jgi:hypothetical protein
MNSHDYQVIHPASEAKFFVSMAQRGVDTIERTRSLIAVSEAEENELRKMFEPHRVLQILDYRRAILKHFEDQIKEIGPPRRAKLRRLSRNVRKCPFPAAGRNSVSLSL